MPKIISYVIRKIPSIIKVIYRINGIKKIKPDFVIARATPNWLCWLAKKTFNNSPFIYFPYDVRSNCYKNLDEALRLGIPKMEISAEKYCFEKSDGIIHKSDEDELKILNNEVLGNIKINCPTLYFFPYCLKKFFSPINEKEKLSKKDKNIRLVYVGHVPFDEGWIDGIEQLSKQKIYLHLYSKTVNLSQLEEENRIKRSLNKVLNNKYLKIHKAVSQELLSKEISKYDYGMYSYSTKEEINAAMATGNKLASYMEAGLPIICPEWYKSTAKIIKGYKIGLIFKPHQFNFLKDTIKKSNYKKLQKNILKTREKLCMEKQFPRLLEFFKEVEQYHKQKNKK